MIIQRQPSWSESRAALQFDHNPLKSLHLRIHQKPRIRNHAAL
jgi:hypothetical protein